MESGREVMMECLGAGMLGVSFAGRDLGVWNFEGLYLGVVCTSLGVYGMFE